MCAQPTINHRFAFELKRDFSRGLLHTPSVVRCQLLSTYFSKPLSMSAFLDSLTLLDQISILFFLLVWILFEIVNDHTAIKKHSLSGIMTEKRTQWMLVMARRDMRMIDTQINGGLQRGAAFFASTSIIAIGGCFALLGSTDIVLQVFQDIPIKNEVSRGLWQTKVLGLALIFTYDFFKFGWSYRLYNYCGILIGATPLVTDIADNESHTDGSKEALRAANMNIIAARHFSAGLRGIFFASGYMGWFIGPKMLMASTVFVLLVLIRRQFYSNARHVLDD